MSYFLRQSTASQEVPLGYFLDSADGNTEETALTIANTDVKLHKQGGTSLVSKNSGGATHMANGVYYATLDATDTDTIGMLVLFVHVAGALYVKVECVVLDEAVYDSLFGTTALSTYAGGAVASVTGAVGSVTGNVGGNVVGSVASVTAGVTVTTNNDKTGYTLSSAGIQAVWDALTSALTTVGSVGKLLVDNVNATIGSRSSHAAADVWAVATRLLTAGTNIVLAKGTGVTGFTDLDAAGVRTAVGLASANLDTQLGALPTAAENSDAVWDEAIAGHAGVGSTGEALANATAPTAAAVADAVWDEAISGHLGAGSTGNALNAAGSAGDPWSTPIPGAYGAGTAGKILGDNINATIGSRASQTSVDDLPTNAELSTALGTADDAVLAAVAALNDLSQADIRAALGLASANLDTQLDALPTNAELATALASADDAVLAAIAALNNLSQANVRTALGLASANLDTQLADLPTNAELTAALAAADDAVLAAITALNNLSAAQVNAEVVDALSVDIYAEPSAPPAATATLAAKINWLTILARNVVTQTATQQKVKADNGTTDVGTATVSDDGTTFTRGEFA
jgi:hypothetical protein